MKFLEKAPIYYKLNIVQRVALTSLPPNQKFNQSVSSKGIPRISPKYNQTTLSNARMSENEKSETRIFQPSNTEIEMGRPHIQSGYDNPVRTSICASVLPMQKSFITHT